MKFWLTAAMMAGFALSTAHAGGKAPAKSDRGVASKEEAQKEPRKSCLNGEEMQSDGTCVRIERQRPYRPDRL